MHQLKASVRNTQTRVKRLERKLAISMEKRGTTVDKEVNSDLVAIMEERNDHVISKYDESKCLMFPWSCTLILDWFYQILFGESFGSSRKKLLELKLGMQCAGTFWWFASVFTSTISLVAHELVCQSGVISLPSQHTLRDYTCFHRLY